MSIRQPAIAVAIAALFVGLGSVSVPAQENCGSQYQQVMQAYQMQSPQYGQMLDQYNARCLSNSPAMPDQTPYAYQAPYGYQAPYAYQQPTVDPGAAFLGGVVGGVVGGALEGDRRGRYEDGRRRVW